MRSAVTKRSESYKFVVSYLGCSRNFLSHKSTYIAEINPPVSSSSRLEGERKLDGPFPPNWRSQSQIEKWKTMKKYGKTQAEGQQALPCAFFDLFDLRNLGITGLFNTKILRDFVYYKFIKESLSLGVIGFLN